MEDLKGQVEIAYRRLDAALHEEVRAGACPVPLPAGEGAGGEGSPG